MSSRLGHQANDPVADERLRHYRCLRLNKEVKLRGKQNGTIAVTITASLSYERLILATHLNC